MFHFLYHLFYYHFTNVFQFHLHQQILKHFAASHLVQAFLEANKTSFSREEKTKSDYRNRERCMDNIGHVREEANTGTKVESR